MNWVGKVFEEPPTEYRATRNRIMDENGNLRERISWNGRDTLLLPGNITNLSMHSSIQECTSAVLSKREMDELGWQDSFSELLPSIVSQEKESWMKMGRLGRNFLEWMGTLLLSRNTMTNPDMQQAFYEHLFGIEAREKWMGWVGEQFYGTVAEYRTTRKKIIG